MVKAESGIIQRYMTLGVISRKRPGVINHVNNNQLIVVAQRYVMGSVGVGIGEGGGCNLL